MYKVRCPQELDEWNKLGKVKVKAALVPAVLLDKNTGFEEQPSKRSLGKTCQPRGWAAGN